MALWWDHEPWRDASEFGRQSSDGRARQYAVWKNAERLAHPGLWLGRPERQLLHQHGARRQFAGGLQLQSELGPARPGGAIYRAASRHGSEGSRRLGFPPRADLRRELSLHHGLWTLEQPAPEPERR